MCKQFLIKVILSLVVTSFVANLVGCVTVLPREFEGQEPKGLDSDYKVSYYKYEQQAVVPVETLLKVTRHYTLKRVSYTTPAGETVIDYYQRLFPSQEIIFVFPILGGTKNPIENYFAEYFAERGYDTAIVHRGKDFKDPKHFNNLEKLLRDTVIRDRIAIDYFQQVHKKKHFASFGISRGAINAAVTAGIDRRLEYNVLALGGSDLSRIMMDSREYRIEKYRDEVKAQEEISDSELELRLASLTTDPKYFAQGIDPRKTLMFLALFDSSVPIESGEALRVAIGNPKTTYLLAGHRTSLLFTQILPLFPPCKCFGLFPFDYIESESLRFYDQAFGKADLHPKHYLFELFQLPGYIYQWLSS